jgi:hypothetical protein
VSSYALNQKGYMMTRFVYDEKMCKKYFRDRVEKSGECLTWTGATKKNGAGCAWPGGGEIGARRLSLLLTGGKIEKNENIRVTCGNKLCVNPDHLYLAGRLKYATCPVCKKTYGCKPYLMAKRKYCSISCAGTVNGKISADLERIAWNKKCELEKKEELKERFEKCFDKRMGKCWNWHAAINGNGYGSFKLRGKVYSSNRMSWTIYNGEIPEGMHVLHKCDNRKCVNPKHLFLGTQLDNTRDMLAKKRWHRKSLDPTRVRQIKKKIAAGAVMSRLAKDYGVSLFTIKCIKYGKKWKDV